MIVSMPRLSVYTHHCPIIYHEFLLFSLSLLHMSPMPGFSTSRFILHVLLFSFLLCDTLRRHLLLLVVLFQISFSCIWALGSFSPLFVLARSFKHALLAADIGAPLFFTSHLVDIPYCLSLINIYLRFPSSQHSFILFIALCNPLLTVVPIAKSSANSEPESFLFLSVVKCILASYNFEIISSMYILNSADDKAHPCPKY
jgi:hypothetical protein